MLRKSTGTAVSLYGALLIICGFIGYYKGHSTMSLVIGSIFGSLLIISSLLIHYKKAIGSYLALILTTILTATFAYRYTITGKTFPAVLAVFSAAMLLFLLARYAKWKKE